MKQKKYFFFHFYAIEHKEGSVPVSWQLLCGDTQDRMLKVEIGMYLLHGGDVQQLLMFLVLHVESFLYVVYQLRFIYLEVS